MSEANDYYSPDQDHRVCRRTDNIRTNYLSFLSQCCQQLVLCIGQLCFCTPQCVEVPGDKRKPKKFWAFIDPSGQNQLYHTPLLSKI